MSRNPGAPPHLAQAAWRPNLRRCGAWVAPGLVGLALFAIPGDGTLARSVDVELAALPTPPARTVSERLAAARSDLEAGRVRDAEEKALRLYEETAHSGTSLEAQVLNLLVETQWRARKSRQPRTLELAERAVAANTTLHGPVSPQVAESLLNLMIVQRTAARYEIARALGDQALQVLQAAELSRSIQAAEVIFEQGNIDFSTGDHAAAIQKLTGAKALVESLPDAPRTTLANILNSLAASYGRSGDFVRARQIHERALTIRLEELGPDHPRTAETYNNLAVLLAQMGDNATSLEMRRRVVEIRALHYGADAALTLGAQSNLANALRHIGDDGAARELYARLVEQLDAEQHARQRASTLVGLGLVEQKSGDHVRALACFTEALEINERVLGPEHLRVAKALVNRAGVRYETGKLTKAEDDCRRALDIRRRMGHDATPGMAEALVLLAAILEERGQIELAFDAALEAETVAATHLAVSARAMARREALQYANVRARGFDLLIKAAMAKRASDGAPDAERVLRAWDALVKFRAIVLEQMVGRRRTTAGTTTPVVEELRERWQTAVERHATLAFAADGSDVESRSRQLRAARDEMEAAERALAEATAQPPSQNAARRVGLREVAAALPPHAALVAYAVHGIDAGPDADNSLFWLRRAYPRGRELVALVLRHGKPPIALPLGPMHDIDKRVGSWAAEAAFGLTAAHRTPRTAEAAYRIAGTELRRAIWDPVRALLEDEARIFVVLEASLHLVTYAALPGASDDDYLVDAGLRFHYLAAERDLVERPAVEVGHGVLALGGADFDTPQGEWSVRRSASRSERDERVATRALRWQCPALDALRFAPLPNTTREVEELARTWRGATHGSGAPADDVVLTGAAATSGAFKRHAPGRRILHLATHGFFLGNGCESPAGSRGIRARHGIRQPLPESPFLQSGLALAGANNRAARIGLGGDGILTAEEIAAMDLRTVEWAVLSACETGRGELQAGEGVLGLRRAFQIAGVRSVITSLWAVSDAATREWMRELYEARLEHRLDTLDAVHTATLRTLRARRERSASTHPFYWAGFVGTGDWN